MSNQVATLQARCIHNIRKAGSLYMQSISLHRTITSDFHWLPLREEVLAELPSPEPPTQSPNTLSSTHIKELSPQS